MRIAKSISRWDACLILPHITKDEGFLIGDADIETRAGVRQAAVSFRALREAAKRFPEIGLVGGDELASAREANEQLAHALAESQAAVAELEDQLSRISGVARQGFRVQKITGRPPTKKRVHANA